MDIDTVDDFELVRIYDHLQMLQWRPRPDDWECFITEPEPEYIL